MFRPVGIPFRRIGSGLAGVGRRLVGTRCGGRFGGFGVGIRIHVGVRVGVGIRFDIGVLVGVSTVWRSLGVGRGVVGFVHAVVTRSIPLTHLSYPLGSVHAFFLAHAVTSTYPNCSSSRSATSRNTFSTSTDCS